MMSSPCKDVGTILIACYTHLDLVPLHVVKADGGLILFPSYRDWAPSLAVRCTYDVNFFNIYSAIPTQMFQSISMPDISLKAALCKGL